MDDDIAALVSKKPLITASIPLNRSYVRLLIMVRACARPAVSVASLHSYHYVDLIETIHLVSGNLSL